MASGLSERDVDTARSAVYGPPLTREQVELLALAGYENEVTMNRRRSLRLKAQEMVDSGLLEKNPDTLPGCLVVRRTKLGSLIVEHYVKAGWLDRKLVRR